MGEPKKSVRFLNKVPDSLKEQREGKKREETGEIHLIL